MTTKATVQSVDKFLSAITDADCRADCRAVAEIMRKATGAEPKMWGPSIVGFGDCVYKYDSGRELDWFMVGFSPRKQALTLYLMGGLQPHAASLKKLGKYKRGKGRRYINRLADVDINVLSTMVKDVVALVKKK